MKVRTDWPIPQIICSLILLIGLNSLADAQEVTVPMVLAYQPAQDGVEFETPTGEDVGKCELKVEAAGKGSAWVVTGPQGQVIRRFVDTDGNGTVDQFRYFQHGLEVYRDFDTNENRKIDESRWLNMGGTRWGIDRNENGIIDEWKVLSAEEATKEAVAAMAARNVEGLSALMVSAGDVRQLGLESELSKQLLTSVENIDQQLTKVLKGSSVVTPQSKWVRFDTSMLMPGRIPAESGKSTQDLNVYENVMALVETGKETGFILVGEMVRVGDVWKLTRIPLPLEGDNAQIPGGEGILMQPELPGLDSMPGGGDLSPEVRKLLEELTELDKTAPSPTSPAKAHTDYHVARARILGELANVAKSAAEREQWKRQQIDGIAAATQTGMYAGGLQQLQEIEAQVSKGDNEKLLSYVIFRRTLAEYNSRLQQANNAKDREAVQEWWLEQLESYVKTHTASDDAPDAALQLAIGKEFNSKVKEARGWYEAIVKNFPTAPAAKRARGAVRRLNLVGQPLDFGGDALGGGQIELARYRGRVLLVIFWATWCEPCTKDLPQIQALYKQHRQSGFEIVGINLDMPDAPVKEYINEYKIPWPHIMEEGGLESRPATDFGIISLPTMLLVDKTGKVVSVSTSVDELKKELDELLK